MNIVTIKLTTDDEVVGKRVDMTDDKIVLNRPMMFDFDIDDKTGEISIYFVDYLLSLSDDANVTFWRNNIVAGPEKTRQEIAFAYVQEISGISDTDTETVN